jgi:hypothetical protein
MSMSANERRYTRFTLRMFLALPFYTLGVVFFGLGALIDGGDD